MKERNEETRQTEGDNRDRGRKGAREAKLADRRNGAARGRAIGERKERETEKEGERADGRLA